jgi:hypothetical protein
MCVRSQESDTVTQSNEEGEARSSDVEKFQAAQQQIEQDNRRETRRHRRLELEADVTVRSESGLLPGRTLDLSESGLSAILLVELQEGETVELKIQLPIGVATARAVVRSRNVFRHGFEFLQPMRDVVRHEAAADDCQSCSGTGLIVQAVNGGQGVAFMRTRCSECGGAGRGSN